MKKLISCHKGNKKYGILSPIHLNGSGNKLDEKFSYYLGYNETPKIFSDSILNKLSGLYETTFVNAAGWLIPKRTLKVVGGFDPLFFHYGEDNNYCQRLEFHGLKIGILSDSFLMHDREFRVKDSIKKFSDEHLEYNLKILKNKYANPNLNVKFKIEFIKIFKKILRSFMLLKFSNVIFNLKLLRLFYFSIKEIEKSKKMYKMSNFLFLK